MTCSSEMRSSEVILASDTKFFKYENHSGKASDDDAVQKFKDAEKLAAMQNRKK